MCAMIETSAAGTFVAVFSVGCLMSAFVQLEIDAERVSIAVENSTFGITCALNWEVVPCDGGIAQLKIVCADQEANGADRRVRRLVCTGMKILVRIVLSGRIFALDVVVSQFLRGATRAWDPPARGC